MQDLTPCCPKRIAFVRAAVVAGIDARRGVEQRDLLAVMAKHRRALAPQRIVRDRVGPTRAHGSNHTVPTVLTTKEFAPSEAAGCGNVRPDPLLPEADCLRAGSGCCRHRRPPRCRTARSACRHGETPPRACAAAHRARSRGSNPCPWFESYRAHGPNHKRVRSFRGGRMWQCKT